MPTPQKAQACAIKQSIVFLWVPYRSSRFHATANIRCTLQYILNQRKIWRNRIYVCIYIYIYIYTVYITEYSVDLYMFGYLEAAAASMTFVFFHKWFLTNKVWCNQHIINAACWCLKIRTWEVAETIDYCILLPKILAALGEWGSWARCYKLITTKYYTLW